MVTKLEPNVATRRMKNWLYNSSQQFVDSLPLKEIGYTNKIVIGQEWERYMVLCGFALTAKNLWNSRLDLDDDEIRLLRNVSNTIKSYAI